MTDDFDITALREHCIQNGLNFFTELKKIQDAKKEGLAQASFLIEKLAKKTQISPDIIIDEKLRELEKTQAPSMSLDRFVDIIKKSLEEANIPAIYNCPLRDYVANAIYNFIDQKTNKKHTREEIKQKTLGRLDDLAITEILGELRPEYIRQKYPLNKSNEFRDARGTSFNVGGTECWPGKKKEDTRETLLDFVDIQLLQNCELNIDREKAESRINSLKQQLAELEANRKDKALNFEVSHSGGGDLHSFIKYFVKFTTEKKKINMTTSYQKKSKTASLLFKSQEDKNKFLGEINDAGIRHRYKYLNSIRLIPMQTKEEQAVKENLEKLSVPTRGDGMAKSRPAIRYLGLEGPSFCSYLQLSNMLWKKGVNMTGYVVEYNQRHYNLMKSIKNAGLITPLNNVKLRYGNIDDMILLDFPDDSNITLSDDDTVAFKQQKMPLEKYHSVIAALNKGTSSKEISSQFDISDAFLKAIADKDTRKFDVVFLDFNGPTSQKREKAMEYLIKNRLSNNAVIAATLNISHFVNPARHKEVKTLKDRITNAITNPFFAEGYNCRDDINDTAYTDNKSNMYFVVCRGEKK